MKKGQSWYFAGKDAVTVVYLQKSDWSDEYYVNIGIWLLAFGEVAFPQDNHYHFGSRAEALFPQKREIIFLGASLEEGDQETLAALVGFNETQLIPFLKQCTDESRLREFLAAGRLENGLLRWEARDYLTRT